MSENQSIIFKNWLLFQGFLEGEMGEEVEEEAEGSGGEEARPRADRRSRHVHGRRLLHLLDLSVPRRQQSR